MGVPPWYLLAFCTLISLSMIWGMWKQVLLASSYSCGGILYLARWKWPLWQVFLCCCSKWGACSFSLSRLVCVLSRNFWRKYSFLLFPFCQSFLMEAPYIPHALPSQTVFDLLSQRHNRLCHFISDIVDYLLAGEDQQLTNQPNDLAGG